MLIINQVQVNVTNVCAMSSIHDLIVQMTGLTFVNTKQAHQCSLEHQRLQSPRTSEAIIVAVPLTEETRPKMEQLKKAPRAETGDDTKWETSPRVPGA
jgi:hypothetical protein